jgi:hypothetical protein
MWMLGLDLDAGAKLALIGARSFGPFDVEARGVFVWPKRESLASRINVRENTLKSQLKKLVKRGLLRAESRKIDGEWRRGWVICDPPMGHQTPGSPDTRVMSHPASGHESPWTGSPDTRDRVMGHPHTLQDLTGPSNDLADDASARPEPIDKCGLCTIDLGGPLDTWARRVHPECLAHRDIKPDTPDPSEHTHGDTPRQTEARAGAVGVPATEIRPAHVEASLARANGHDPRGAGGHRGGGVGSAGLAERNAAADLAEVERLARIAARRAQPVDDAAHAFEQAVAAVGPSWSRRIQDKPSWRQAMHAAREAMRLTPDQGRRIAEVWEAEAEGGLSPGQPDLDELWSRWSETREWVRKASQPGPSLYAVPAPEAYVDDPWGGLG